MTAVRGARAQNGKPVSRRAKSSPAASTCHASARRYFLIIGDGLINNVIKMLTPAHNVEEVIFNCVSREASKFSRYCDRCAGVVLVGEGDNSSRYIS